MNEQVLTLVDCNNDVNSTAAIDMCNICSGGNTGIVPNSSCIIDPVTVLLRPGIADGNDTYDNLISVLDYFKYVKYHHDKSSNY